MISSSERAFMSDIQAFDLLSVDMAEDLSALDRLQFATDLDSKMRPSMVFMHRGIMVACAEKARQRGHIAIAMRVWRGGVLETVWPMKVQRRLGFVVATDLTSPITQYSDVMGRPLDPAGLGRIADFLRDRFSVDVLLARNLRGDSGLAEAFALTGNSVVARSSAPYIDLAAFRDYDAYVACFSKNSTRTRRQRRQKLESERGLVGFKIATGLEAQAFLRVALDWKRDWLEAQGLSSRVFDRGLSEQTLINACDDPDACVSVLTANDQPVAIELGFVGGNHYVAYLGAYDPAYADYSVGQEQMMETIRWCMGQGISRYDLLPPEADYKVRWTRGQPPVPVTDHALALSTLGKAYVLALRYGKSNVRKLVEAMPPLLRRRLMRNRKVIVGGALTATAITGIVIAM